MGLPILFPEKMARRVMQSPGLAACVRAQAKPELEIAFSAFTATITLPAVSPPQRCGRLVNGGFDGNIGDARL